MECRPGTRRPSARYGYSHRSPYPHDAPIDRSGRHRDQKRDDEHRKAVKNRKRDLEAHHEHTHNYSRRTIAGGVIVVNAAPTFKSPLRREPTRHKDSFGPCRPLRQRDAERSGTQRAVRTRARCGCRFGPVDGQCGSNHLRRGRARTHGWGSAALRLIHSTSVRQLRFQIHVLSTIWVRNPPPTSTRTRSVGGLYLDHTGGGGRP